MVPFLGGQDVNRNLVDYLLRKLKEEQSDSQFENESVEEKVRHLLNQKCERAKKVLMKKESTQIRTQIELIYDFNSTLTKNDLNMLTLDLQRKIKENIGYLLKEAKLRREQIDHIILEGGST